MSDSTRSLIPAATKRFTDVVHAVPADGWSRPTPCTDWSTSDVANHLVYEHLWVPHILGGETIEQVGDRYEGDLVGDDPVGAWDGAAAGSVAAFTGVESDDLPVHLSFGTVPVEEYAGQMLVDLVVHGWDLARGAGVDDRMDPDTVAAALAYSRSRAELYAASGLFAAPVDTGSEDPQDQLLALLGRDPAWSAGS